MIGKSELHFELSGREDEKDAERSIKLLQFFKDISEDILQNGQSSKLVDKFNNIRKRLDKNTLDKAFDSGYFDKDFLEDLKENITKILSDKDNNLKQSDKLNFVAILKAIEKKINNTQE